jgi:ATP-dependent exoDNAse (exonuclease V) beta subunit
MIIGNMVKTTGVSRVAAARHLETCCALGSEAHAQIEVFFTNPGENAVPSFFAEFFATHLQGRFRLVGAEVRVYDEQTKVAGTIDLVVAPIGGACGEDVLEVVIFDWKYTKGHGRSERYERQLQTYAELLEGVAGVKVVAMYNVFLQEGQTYYVRAVKGAQQ